MFDFQERNLPNYILFIYLFIYLSIYLIIYLLLKKFEYTQCAHVYTNNILEKSIRTGRLSIRTKRTDLWNSIPCKIEESYTLT